MQSRKRAPDHCINCSHTPLTPNKNIYINTFLSLFFCLYLSIFFFIIIFSGSPGLNLLSFRKLSYGEQLSVPPSWCPPETSFSCHHWQRKKAKSLSLFTALFFFFFFLSLYLLSSIYVIMSLLFLPSSSLCR